mgnify:CR=1 FL=1
MIIILYFLQQRCIFNHTLLPKFYNRTQFRIDKCILRFIGNCLQNLQYKARVIEVVEKHLVDKVHLVSIQDLNSRLDNPRTF